MKILVTGGAGFIGESLVKKLLEDSGNQIIHLAHRRPGPVGTRITTFFHDLRAPIPEHILSRLTGTDTVIHLAAEVSGVRSLQDPEIAVTTNVMGTENLLEAATKLDIKKFIYISTGEVVGNIPAPDFADENVALRPSNPYSAAKAAGEELCRAYRISLGLPTLVIRLMNVFGPGQKPPRFIPLVARAILSGEYVTCHTLCDVIPGECLYGDVPGSRNWSYIMSVAHWLKELAGSGKVGETYHLVGPELDNLQIILTIGDGLGIRFPLVRLVVPPLSHDLRYALRDTKLNLVSDPWLSEAATLDSIRQTAGWYMENRSCLGF